MINRANVALWIATGLGFLVLSVFVSGVASMAGCAKHVPIDSKRFELVQRTGYAYQRYNDGELVVAAKSQRELEQALKEIGCGSEYICMIEPSGDLYQVLQRRK